MSRFSHTTTATLVLATLLLSACGGGDTGTESESTSSLLTLDEESQYAAQAVSVMTPMLVLSASGDFVKLPQSEAVSSAKARQAKAMVKAAKQAKTASAKVVREVEACGAGGEVVIETEGSVVTAWFKACRETETVDGVAFNTEQDGWARYTILPSTEFEEAYAIEEDSVFKIKGGDTDYAEHLQARMRYFQEGQRLRLEDVDYTLTDKGSYLGQSYDYTTAARKLTFTSDPQAGVTFSGRVGGWGTFYNGEPMMNGQLEVASVVPMFFDQDDFPNRGSVRVKGGHSTTALVQIHSEGYRLELNGQPSLDIRW